MCAHFSSNSLFIQKLTEITEENLGDENFGVNELSTEIGLSHSQIHRKLKLINNQSTSQFIREIRLKKAKELLLNDGYTVSEIAFKVGFNSPSYFNKCFHEFFGYPPGAVNADKNKLNKGAEHPEEEHPHPYPNKTQTKVLKPRVIFFTVLVVFCLLYLFYLIIPNKQVQQKPISTENSIAVLPLKNFTGETNNAHIINGLHDLLIGEIAQTKDLRVISRSSASRYKDSNLLLKDIAQELGVNCILESSLMKFGDSIQLIAQLIDVFPNERHLMSKEYSDHISNILKVHSAVAHDVTSQLNIASSSNKKGQAQKTRAVNPKTFKAYLAGMYYINQGTDKSFIKGVKYLQQAIENDPADPLAYGALALGFATMGHGLYSSEESFHMANSAANTALKLDPSNDEAYTALALLHLYQTWEWDKANESFSNAILRNPNNEIAHAHYAWYFVLMNEKEKSIYHAKQAALLNPLYPSYSAWLSLIYYTFNEPDDAEKWANKTLTINKNTPYALATLGWVYCDRLLYEEAISYHTMLPETDYFKVFLGYTYLKAGQKDKALELWSEFELKAESQNVNPCNRGMMAAYLGYHDQAFELLNEAFEEKKYPINYLNFFPFTSPIRSDVRYIELMNKMHLNVKTRE